MKASEIRSVHRHSNYFGIAGRLSRRIGLAGQRIALHVFRFTSLPHSINLRLLLDSLLNSQFMIYHEFSTGGTFLITENADSAKKLESGTLGLGLDCVYAKEFAFNRPRYVVALDPNPIDKEEPRLPLDDFYTILKDSRSGLFVSFVPTDAGYVRETKGRVEDLMSRKDVRMARNFGDRSSSASGSVQSELYYDSDEKRASMVMLETLNEAMLNNGSSYKVSLVLEDGDERRLGEYIRLKLFVLEEKAMKIGSVEELFERVRGEDAFPLSYGNAARMLNFSGAIKRVKVITAAMEPDNSDLGELSLGFYLDGSVYATGKKIMTSVSTLNLGMLITGLPGSGKTFAAMEVVNQVAKAAHPKLAVISPTEEWVPFGLENRMEVVRLYGHGPRINFFRCGKGMNAERFYENLAMLIAHASNAGPYRNSIEKCLLSAFNKIYSRTKNPDPVEVYDEIEEAVIEQHGKRSSVGVKYTKHGENIRAGLENLRLMLLKPQFAYAEGLEFERLLEKGVVFDLSRISNNMKPFFYALVLNQVYANADALDVEGNDDLRMLICLEEAQLIFDNGEQSAATMDLRQRIQDFRKKGIGMMLITHSVTDINLRIRRLCQTKMYFRQSADAVRYAAADLMVEEKAVEELADRLKTLEHRTCIINYMSSKNGIKNPENSAFVRIPEYGIGREKEVYGYPITPQPETKVRILDQDGNPAIGIRIEIRYVGERVYQGRTESEGLMVINGLLEGKEYRLFVLGEKKKQTRGFDIVGGRESVIKLGVA